MTIFRQSKRSNKRMILVAIILCWLVDLIRPCEGFFSSTLLQPVALRFQHYSTRCRSAVTVSSASSATESDGVSPSVSNNNRLLSVAVVGAGAVGSYYGARLAEAGHNVTFYLRGPHYEACTKQGLQVTSVDGDIYIAPEELQAVQDTKDLGPVDWVVVAFKSSSLDAIAELILPLMNESTRVLVIMNGLIEDDLIRMLQKEAGEPLDDNNSLQCCQALYGGMALICSNRLEPGRVDHSYAGLLSAGVACSRSSSMPTEDDKTALLELFEPTKVETIYEPCLLRGRWKKMVWNLPFNGISVAMGGITVDRIVNDPSLRNLADIVMDETIAVANTDLRRKYGDNNFEPLGDAEKKQMMTLSDNMGPYRTSTMIDLTERRSMEVEYLFGKPVERAHQLGVPVPHLETLVSQIEALQRFYKLF